MIETLLSKISSSKSVQELNNYKRNMAFSSNIEEACILASSFVTKPRNIVVVKENAYQAQNLFQKLTPLLKAHCALFDVEESLRVQAITSSLQSSAGRIETLQRCLSNDPLVLVTHIGACATNLMSPQTFKELSISLKKDQIITIQELKQRCQDAGYNFVARVDQPLCYAVRGGIIDVFSINYEYPLRIEFFDNEIESIRFFDIATQRTISLIDEVTILCAGEIIFNENDLRIIQTNIEKELDHFRIKSGNSRAEQVQEILSVDFEYLQNHISESRLYPYFYFLDRSYNLLDYIDNAQVILSNPTRLNDHMLQLNEECVSYVQEMVQENKMLPTFNLYQDHKGLFVRNKVTEVEPFYNSNSNIRQTSLPEEPLSVLVDILNDQAHESTVLLCLNDIEIEEFIKVCLQKEVPYKMFIDFSIQNGLYLVNEFLDEGFEIIDQNILIYSSRECFKKKKKSARFINKFNQAEALSSYQDLNPKDYIVHQQYGVGQYIGIITRQFNNVHKDYLQVLYKGNDELLVPLEQFSLVRKFVSREAVTPKLNKLGSNEWAKTKEKLQANVEEIAERLIELYSVREDNIGFAFSPDSEDQINFEEDFEYDLTADQAIAVQEVKADMMKPKPMDRLLCGDVGFGKTEVSIRAAFKAVLDGKQVAFLCPTTILASQHFKTFLHRFRNYPVNVQVLNRFVPDSVQKQIIQDTKEGKVDILIGTHRILSKDVKFKDLGFLIIDEEQRFGVEHKEKIKEMKNTIDVLSLSATPIPRTLQMSLIGVRSLSQLDTPPNNRYPVQTYVVEKNQNLIIDVIEKELSRRGQIFYLYNNIDEIYSVARKIQSKLPDARVSVAHGKMNRDEIEEVMVSFENHDIDVLVCTTIIETGIDIPNANTILIENAERFGLSQLYQIKGRVGRSDRVAYAYLMVNRFKQLTEIASKRLQSIKEFTQLGSGYKIAMRDLTIRGAGDLLGPSQSGFIDAVGIDYYIEVLQDAINAKKGIIKAEKEVVKKPNVSVDSYIPETFAPQDLEKITMYQQIDKISSLSALQDYMNEIKDNFGHFPKSVQLLFEKKRLEILINDPSVEQFKELPNGSSHIILSEEFSNIIDGVKLFELLTTLSKDIVIRYMSNKIQITIPKRQDYLQLSIEVLIRSKTCIKS